MVSVAAGKICGLLPPRAWRLCVYRTIARPGSNEKGSRASLRATTRLWEQSGHRPGGRRLAQFRLNHSHKGNCPSIVSVLSGVFAGKCSTIVFDIRDGFF